MAWRSRYALLVLAAAFAVLLLVQTDVARLLLGPFFGARLHENVMARTHGKTYYAESMQAGLLSAEMPLSDTEGSQHAGIDGVFDEEVQSVDDDQSLTGKYDLGESDERSDATQQADDAPDVDYDYAVFDDTAFPTHIKQSTARMSAFNLDWIFGKAATAIGSGQDSTDGEIGSGVNGATQPSNTPARKVETRLTSTAKPLVKFTSKKSQSGISYASSKSPVQVSVFSGTGGNSGDQSNGLSGNNRKSVKHNDQKLNSSQQTIRSLPWPKMVSETPAVSYQRATSANRIAATNNIRGGGVSSLIKPTMSIPADQESPAGFGGRLSSATESLNSSSIKTPESTQASAFATVPYRNSDGDRSTDLNTASSLDSSLPVVLFTQDKNSSRSLSHVIISSNSRASNKGKINSHPTLATTNVAPATGVNEARLPMYDSDVTSSTYTAEINRTSIATTIGDEWSIQRILAATAGPGSLGTGTFSEQSHVSVSLWSTSEQRPDVSLVITAPVKSSNSFTASSSPLSMGMTHFSEKLFLVSAHSDFRKSPPTVKIVIFAHRDFNEAMSCVHGEVVRSAQLSWINYVTEERAVWRAGYVECEVPTMTTSAEPRIELRSSLAAPGAAGVVIPLGHTPTLPLWATSATVSGMVPDSSITAPKFGMCVKSGYGAPSAARFVEWMELHTLLGVAHVILYDQNLHGPVRAAMQHYVGSGRLTVVRDEFRSQLERSRPDLGKLFAGFDATFASGDEPYAQMELLSIQDCFHRFRGLYDYILVADIDEAIVPVSADTLPDLVKILKHKHPNATSFSHQAAAYLPHFSREESVAAGKNSANTEGTGNNGGSDSRVSGIDGAITYMLMHTRHTKISWDGSKAFHSTDDTDVLNWHRRIWPDTNVAYVNPADAWLHHYRSSCKGASCDPNATLVDDDPVVMSRYAAMLTSRVAAVMSHLRPVVPPT